MSAPDSPELVKDISLRIIWHPGFALSQKKKNVVELHEGAKLAGYHTVLEILQHPVYAGAYVFGRTTQRTTILEGRAKKTVGAKGRCRNGMS